MKMYDTIPSHRFWFGKVYAAGGASYVLSVQMPWRRKMYAIHLDEMIVGHPRLVIRFRFGWTIDP